jgi:FdhE protein
MTQDAPALGGVTAEAPWLRLGGDATQLFTARAARLRALGNGHVAADWLQLLAALCDAQARSVAALPAGESPKGDGRPPLGRPDRAWHAALWSIVASMRARHLPFRMAPPAIAALERIADASADEIDRLSDAILDGAVAPGDAAVALFVAAALQASYTARAARLALADVARVERGCPACGFAPVAGIVGGDDKLRYLRCGLCAVEWHVTRVQCTSCGTTAGISYYALQGAAPSVKAESCAACRAYLKLFYREQLPDAEPLADDAATLALDLLLGEEGWARAGVNLLVHV